MEKEKSVTEILGLQDEEIQVYLKSHPKEAERLAKILISAEKERGEGERTQRELEALGIRAHPFYTTLRLYAEALAGNRFAIAVVVIVLLIVFIAAVLRGLYYAGVLWN